MLSKKLYLSLLFCIVVKPTNEFLNQVSQLIGENKTAISVASLSGILGISYSYLKNRNLKSNKSIQAGSLPNRLEDRNSQTDKRFVGGLSYKTNQIDILPSIAESRDSQTTSIAAESKGVQAASLIDNQEVQAGSSMVSLQDIDIQAVSSLDSKDCQATAMAESKAIQTNSLMKSQASQVDSSLRSLHDLGIQAVSQVTSKDIQATTSTGSKNSQIGRLRRPMSICQTDQVNISPSVVANTDSQTDSRLADNKAATHYAVNRLRSCLDQKEDFIKKNAFFAPPEEENYEEDFLKNMLNFENKREEIWSQISRFGKGFPTAYVESLKENQTKINKDTGFDIALEKVYEFLDLDNDFAKSLPYEVVIDLVDFKLEKLKLQGIPEDKINILGRQLKWIFKNEFAKENYDAFIAGILESLVFEDQETYEKLNRDLENIIEAKNAYVELHKLEEKALYGELKKTFVDLIKSNSCIKDLMQRFSGYSPNFWVNGQAASSTIKSIIRGALATYALTHYEDELSKNIISKLDIGNKKDQVIRDIIIYCFALAVYKNQGFSEGSFILQGSNVSQIYEMLTNSGFVRLSSHFKGLNLTQYGLDIADLPEHKTHILFAEIAPNIVFVKPENYGVTGISNLIGHSYEFIVAQACKLGIWGSDQAEGMRKERVPVQEFGQYKEIVNKLDLDADTKQAYLNNAALVGLQEIYKKLQSFEVEYSTDAKLIEDIKALKSQLTAYDHIDKRFGQEVILTDAELSLFSPELLSAFLDQEL